MTNFVSVFQFRNHLWCALVYVPLMVARQCICICKVLRFDLQMQDVQDANKEGLEGPNVSLVCFIGWLGTLKGLKRLRITVSQFWWLAQKTWRSQRSHSYGGWFKKSWGHTNNFHAITTVIMAEGGEARTRRLLWAVSEILWFLNYLECWHARSAIARAASVGHRWSWLKDTLHVKTTKLNKRGNPR